MTAKTEGESLFEKFCSLNEIKFSPIPTGANKTPDYSIIINDELIIVEIKQLDHDKNFQEVGDIRPHHRITGAHIQAKISDSKGQIQIGAKAGAPSILIIYNNLDLFESFGTEEYDFLVAMFGEFRLSKRGKNFIISYQDRNASLRKQQNTSFSAVGHIYQRSSDPKIKLYLNPFAKNPINIESIPSCIETIKIEISSPEI